jgi:hypothetical protein
LPVLDDVQVCDGVGRFEEHVAKKVWPRRSCTTVEALDGAVTGAGVYKVLDDIEVGTQRWFRGNACMGPTSS